jgi:hypothetical protein
MEYRTIWTTTMTAMESSTSWKRDMRGRKRTPMETVFQTRRTTTTTTTAYRTRRMTTTTVMAYRTRKSRESERTAMEMAFRMK